MDPGIITVFGTILGVVIGGFITVNSNEKIARKNYEVELLKLKREQDIERLDHLLKPIIFKYEESDQLLRNSTNNESETFGKGLYGGFIKDLDNLIEKNTKLLSIEMYCSYLEANDPETIARFTEEINESSLREYRRTLGENPESLIDFSFDDERQFINLVYEEAKQIQKKYS